MKDTIFDEFQSSVPQLLVRHKSMLDVMTKYQESNARVNRALAKAVTNCGCLRIDAKAAHPSDTSLKSCRITWIPISGVGFARAAGKLLRPSWGQTCFT